MAEHTSEAQADGGDPPRFPMRRSGCPFDPPPQYAELRADDPAAHATLADGREVRLITRMTDARAVLTHPKVSGDLRAEGFPLPGGGKLPPGTRPSFARMDPPEHTIFRRMLVPDFTVRRVRELRPQIQKIVDDVLDELATLPQPVDLVAAFALPVPSLVICGILGVPYADHEHFQSLAMVMLNRSSTQEQLIAALGAMRQYMTGLLAVKREQPADDILTKLAGAQQERDLEEAELAITAQTVLNAGHETTANMIALGTLYLMEHPEILSEAVADPSLWPGVVEELLRYLSIGDLVSPRVALGDIELSADTIRPGEGMYVLNAAANRDADAFDRPDEFNPRRTDNHHLAFGYGVHQCLGQHLARAELEIVFASLFARLPKLRLAVPVEELSFKHEAAIYGLYALPVTWSDQ
jgi:pentalenic acid synthase